MCVFYHFPLNTEQTLTINHGMIFLLGKSDRIFLIPSALSNHAFVHILNFLMRKRSTQRKLYNCMKSFGPSPRAVDSLLLAGCFFYQTVLLLRREKKAETVDHLLLSCPTPYVKRHCFSPVEQTHGTQAVQDVPTTLGVLVFSL